MLLPRRLPPEVRLPTRSRPAVQTGGGAAKDRIVAAAAELFALKGYKSTSIDDVAAHAGTSRSLIFWHFESKEGLLEAAVDRLCTEYVQFVTDGVADRVGLDAIRAMVAMRRRMLEERAELGRLIFLLIGDAIGSESATAPQLTALDHKVSEFFESWLEAARVGGELPPDVSVPRLAGLVVSAFHGNAQRWLLSPESFDIVQADAAVVEFLEALRPGQPRHRRRGTR
jgi:AcrR family transcriptional regulator